MQNNKLVQASTQNQLQNTETIQNNNPTSQKCTYLHKMYKYGNLDGQYKVQVYIRDGDNISQH